MKFITEEDLRDLYRKQPFTAYNLEQGARLTPGARQFLMDKGINMFDSDFCNTEKKTDVKIETPLVQKKDACKNKKLIYKMKSIEALFFLTEEELLRKDVCLAQSVITLSKQFTRIKNAVKSKSPVENLCCSECTGINTNNFSEDLDDCFEISEFHIQLEKGREIVLLHRLRCELNDLNCIVPELYESIDMKISDDNGTSSNGISSHEISADDIIGKVNQIVNSLSQLICLAFGGKKCQRQN